MPLSFGLGAKKTTAKGPVKAVAARSKPKVSGFGAFDDEDAADGSTVAPSDAAQEISTFDETAPRHDESSGHKSRKAAAAAAPQAPTKPPKSKFSAQHGPGLAATHISQKHAAEEESLDPAIYDYDAHYDAIHAAQTARKQAEQEEEATGKPKYMDSLLAAAETRKRDQLRANDKKLQREREQEGDEFADKEKFVTEAYKQQQEEARQLEADEAKKEQQEEEKRRKQGMSGFFKNVMHEQERDHQAAVDAAASFQPGEAPVAEAPESHEQAAAQRVKELNAQGANIILTDEGEIADKRQLLTAGLNITAKPKSHAVTSAPGRDRHGPPTMQTAYRGIGDGKHAQRERQTRMLEEQYEAAAKRKAEEEAEELQKRQQSLKSHKTGGDISDAKARYLERKKAQAAAAAAAAPTSSG